jgi:DUF1680 family protein
MNQHAKQQQFRPLPVPSVELRGFWGDRQNAVCDATAAILLDRCIAAGMKDQIDASIAPPPQRIPFHGGLVTAQMFWDSDFGKSIETIAYSLYRQPNAELEARADEIIDLYGKLQQADG